MDFLTIAQCLELHPGPSVPAITQACRMNNIPGAVRHGPPRRGLWLIPRQSYLDWVRDFPHKPGKKTASL